MRRRDFLRHAGTLSAAAACGQLGLLGARAQSTGDDYKALVCIFLLGGNDANNLVIPHDATGFAAYSNARRVLGLNKATLAPLTELDGSVRFALHPALKDLTGPWEAGHLGVLFNTGPLLRPLSREEFVADPGARPRGLYSHPDQQRLWQTGGGRPTLDTGWGARSLDALSGSSPPSGVPAMLSIGSSDIFATGNVTRALTLPISGSFGLRGADDSPAAQVRSSALGRLLELDQQAELVAAAQQVMGAALAQRAVLDPILTGPSAAATFFKTLNSNIARQLHTVAKLVEHRARVGARRQVFFISLGGFDTHVNQMPAHSLLLSQLGPALKAFHSSLAALGAAEQVTTFTLSDFNRTLRPNTSGGTDHAWGAHHLVMGAAVQGRRYYGAFPRLELGGPDDASGEGRWIPSTAVDQYAATLASWFGVGPLQLTQVLPNLSAFAPATLDFMR
jgi:uncharacterized protein (DUF1501 family)